MAGLTEEDIRTRAYLLWQAAGEPSGKMDIFWYEAERELLAERLTEERSIKADREIITRQ